ncbi:MAG: hypothetical protein WCO56_29290 [Verrucomicrobiota bacterium]
MNEPNPEPKPIATTALPAYKDRSAGLVIFGILTILLGCLAGLFVPLMLFGQMAAAKAPNAPPVNIAVILPAVAIYGVLAVMLIWLGIGSIQARRWARALLLIFSWSWLVMGIFMVAAMAFVMPQMLANLPANSANGQPAMPPGTMTVVMVVTFGMVGFMFVLLPAVWTFFFSSRHVKATCEARDPVTRWTDACPLPVLGFCLWLLIAVPMMLIIPLAYHGVMPFFGMFLTGLPGTLFCVAIAVLWGYAAWLLYHLDVRGWWLILIALVVFMASALLTYAHHDIVEMYQLMGYPQAQIDQIQKTGLLTGNRMNWLMSASMLPFLGYLLFIKKYLHKT